MVRQAYVALVVAAIVSGCGGASKAAPTYEATASPVPTEQTSPTPTRSETGTPSELPDFRLPQGDTPGWLRNFAHPSEHPSIAFSPDGKLLAVGYGTSIMFWNMVTGQQITVLKHPPGLDGESVVTALKFSPDGNLLAALYVGRVDVWDVTTGQRASILHYPPGRWEGSGVLGFDFNSDGTLLAALYGVYGGRLDMWNVAAGTFQSLTQNNLGSYQEVEFSPDGSRLAVGPSFDPPSGTAEGTDYQVEIWEPTGDSWARQRVLVDARPGFVFSPDGATLATLSGISWVMSAENPGPPVLWNVATGARRELVVDGFPASLEYSPDGTTLAVTTMMEAGGTLDQIGISLVDVSSGQVRRVIKTADNYFSPAIRFSVDGSLLVATYLRTNQIILWNVQTGGQVLTIDILSSGLWNSPVLSPDGRLMAAVSSDGQIVFWNMPK